MKNVSTQLKVVSFSWDFAAGDNPAVGTYNSPLQLPYGAVVKNITVNCTTPFTSSTSNATIAIGWINVTSPLFLGAFFPAVKVSVPVFQPSAGARSAINSGDPAEVFGSTYNFAITPPVGIRAAALKYVTFTIGTEAITAGAATFTIEYY